MRLVDADRFVRQLQRMDQEDTFLPGDIIGMVQSLETEDDRDQGMLDDEVELDQGYGIEVYAFADKIKSNLPDEEMTKQEVAAIIDELLGK